MSFIDQVRLAHDKLVAERAIIDGEVGRLANAFDAMADEASSWGAESLNAAAKAANDAEEALEAWDEAKGPELRRLADYLKRHEQPAWAEANQTTPPRRSTNGAAAPPERPATTPATCGASASE